MKRQKILTVLSIFLFMGIFAVNVFAEPIQLNFAFQDSEASHGYTQALAPWAKQVEEATNGQVKIKIYASQTLTKGPDTWNAVKSGVADLGWCFHGYWPGMTPLADVISLPALPFKRAEKGSEALWKLYEKFPSIQKEFSDNQVLHLWTSEPYMLITSKKWVKTVEDLKGLKIRMTGGPPTDMVKALGGVPLLLPMPDNYLSLQKGVIDGMGVPWEAMHAFRLYEVVKYYTETPFPAVYFSCSMNKGKWGSISKEIQDAIMSVSGLKGSMFWGYNFFDTARAVVEEDVRKSGSTMNYYSLPDKERERWLDAGGKPIWDAWVQKMEKAGHPEAKEILDTLLKMF
ncbi:MAG: TRAP transporter substrate-binding protein [Deltaproteobacteria bacterium]|nr:TRAP transporter substrate-binding protein [Deltaproteobacteria bacterium]